MNPFVQNALEKRYEFPEKSAEIFEGKALDQLDTQEWTIEKHPQNRRHDRRRSLASAAPYKGSSFYKRGW